MKIVRSFIIAWILPLVVFGTAAAKEASGITGDQALQILMTGNKQYVAAKLAHPNSTPERRTELVKGQHPFAIILSCSDSRVPPEIVFDQGLGDLFVVRVAGNVVDDLALGSIEYAAEHLGVPLIMVLGHEKCGAVTATVEGGGKAPGHIDAVVKAIKPAVEKVKDQPGDKVENATRANIDMVVEQLKTSKPVLAELVKDGKLMIVGARYDLDTGVVEVSKE
ncbi:MAG: carbonic anhydrase [bacterium]